jgi:hypothetical protein
MKQIMVKSVGIALLSLTTLKGLPPSPANRSAMAAQDEVAIVAQLEGGVWLQREKKSRPIREVMLLNVGDVIGAEDGGRAVIYQVYAPVARLRAKQSHTIEQSPPPPPDNALTAQEFARLKRILLNAKQRRKEASPRRMGVPDKAVLTISDERNSTVLVREPAFNWTRVSGAQRYVFKIYDRDEKLLWSTTTTETSAAYPKNLPPLAPGDYKWDVTALIAERVESPYRAALHDATTFTLVGEDRAKEIEADLAAARARFADDGGAANLVYLSALIEHKLFPRAAAELRTSLARAPKDQTLWELLMETYAEMRLWGAREDARLLSENSAVTAGMINSLKASR